MQECENKTLLPKILHADNGIIPHQLNGAELKIILERSASKFPFLREVSDGMTTADKILSILSFRIPYYVGPLNGHHSIEDGGHAWIVRKERGEVTPWNFDQKVDRYASAERFIEKMVNTCTYLKGEPVLPKSSILFCKFNVLNQINKLKVNGEPISVADKQSLYREVFLRQERVRKSELKRFFAERNGGVEPEISGLGDGELPNVKSLIQLRVLLGDGVPENILEDIIFWHTLFSDKSIVEHYLKTKCAQYPTVQQNIGRLKSLRFTDFCSLSRKFLEGIFAVDHETGEVSEEKSIIYLLQETNQNLNEILFDRKYGFEKTLLSENGIESGEVTYADVEKLYISPAVKRGVWQAFCMVKEYADALGKAPDKIFVEVTRGGEIDKKVKDSRLKKIQDLFKECKKQSAELKELLESLNKKTESDLRSDRLYLYFMQMGRCMYTGETIDLESIGTDLYDIDHIVPQSMVKDDSLDNRVLVKSEANRIKSDQYPLSNDVVQKNAAFWKLLYDKKFISDKKYKSLLKKEVTEEDRSGFISRQMVFTSQSAKAVCELLKRAYPDTKIVYSKAGNVSDFRKKFGIVKNRDVNNYHHAVDAYLNVVVGNCFDTKFGDPRQFFYQKNGEQRLYNLEKFYEKPIEGAWDPSWIADVKVVSSKNSARVTQMSYISKGEFYNQTKYSPKDGTDGLFPLKGGENPLSDVAKYGGYKSLGIAYFMAVESDGKKGVRKTTLEGMPIVFDYLIGKGLADVNQVCTEYLGLKNPKIVVPVIKKKSLIKINGTPMYLGGKTGSRIEVYNATDWHCDKVGEFDTAEYFKRLSKLVELNTKFKLDEKESDAIEYAVSPSRLDQRKSTVSKATNEAIYDRMILQLEKPIFKSVSAFCNVKETLQKNRDKFLNLSLWKQCIVLLNIPNIFKPNSKYVDLTLLGGSVNCGKALIGKDITDKEIVLINRSITGVYENETVVHRLPR